MGQIDKPKLTIQQQIEQLEARGVTFLYSTKEEAAESLGKTNNYFKLTSYRKNFEMDSQGKYLDLDFTYLKDLSKIDMHLRYCLLEMCLDVEHFAKAKLMTFIEQSSEDGYSIVQEHKKSAVFAPDRHNPSYLIQPYDEIFRKAAQNEYCSDLYHKHKDEMPIWALIEIIQFGTFISLYKFIAEKYGERDMLSDYYIMLDISRIRNATAHNNCILNDMSKNCLLKPSYDVLRALSHFMKKDVYDGKIANTRIRQITSLLYFHHMLITSGTHEYQSERLHRIVDIMYRNIHFYKNNARLLSVFGYLKKLIDNWY